MKEKINIDKAREAILYIVNNMDQADLIHIFKILYFAERKHLAKYGSMIISDMYVAMKNGPVPSTIYDIFKALRNKDIVFENIGSFREAFEVVEFNVIGKKTPNLKYLSKSDLSCINESLSENKNLSFTRISDKSHDSAWASANLNDEINFIDMAIAEGANEEMVKYILESQEYYNIEFNA